MEAIGKLREIACLYPRQPDDARAYSHVVDNLADGENERSLVPASAHSDDISDSVSEMERELGIYEPEDEHEVNIRRVSSI